MSTRNNPFSALYDWAYDHGQPQKCGDAVLLAIAFKEASTLHGETLYMSQVAAILGAMEELKGRHLLPDHGERLLTAYLHTPFFADFQCDGLFDVDHATDLQLLAINFLRKIR